MNRVNKISVSLFGSVSFFFVYFKFRYFIVSRGKIGSPYLGKAEQPQEQRYPLCQCHVCSIFVRPNNGVWLPVLEGFNVRTDVDARDCTRTP